MSHPIPLHPADSLERALDDMRQSVMADGDEVWLMRVLTAQIRLALLTILDTLIDLLARFRAGTLPPIPGCDDEDDLPANRAAESPRSPAACRSRVHRDAVPDTASDALADAAEPSADLASSDKGMRLPAPRLTVLHLDRESCRILRYPWRIPRPPDAAFGRGPTPSTHAHFVAISQ